ncbi:hypothetical protein [Streptomyces sp. NPDC094468]|uniref:hypothetical protein n=1 Tax=Streptomyces sp. NPDC094468 TaxID=3366066 RepID=UPI00382DA07E
MPDVPVQVPTIVGTHVSIVRLHGEACFDCGAVNKPLREAGHVVVLGRKRIWRVRTCGCRPRPDATHTLRTREVQPGDRANGPGDGQR